MRATETRLRRLSHYPYRPPTNEKYHYLLQCCSPAVDILHTRKYPVTTQYDVLYCISNVCTVQLVYNEAK